VLMCVLLCVLLFVLLCVLLCVLLFVLLCVLMCVLLCVLMCVLLCVLMCPCNLRKIYRTNFGQKLCREKDSSLLMNSIIWCPVKGTAVSAGEIIVNVYQCVFCCFFFSIPPSLFSSSYLHYTSYYSLPFSSRPN